MYSIICILAFTDYSFLNTTFYLDLMDEGGGGEGTGTRGHKFNTLSSGAKYQSKIKILEDRLIWLLAFFIFCRDLSATLTPQFRV